MPINVGTTYSYDGLSRLTNIQVVEEEHVPPPTLYSVAYSYDDLDNRTSKTEPSFAETYTYDPIYQFKDVLRSSTRTEGYTHDLVGNRLTSYPSSTQWTYDDRNHLLTTPTATFTYDGNGNMRTKAEAGVTWTYDWDSENRLTRVLKGTKTVATFSYDPLGRRIRKVAGGVTRSYLYDGDDILRESDCLLQMFLAAQRGGRPYPPFGFVFGPNSNTFVNDLLAACGNAPVFPPGVPPFTH